jgi:tape measure domain-containing protein
MGSDAKMEILLTAKNVTDHAFHTVEAQCRELTNSVFSLKAAMVGVATVMGSGEIIQQADTWKLVEGRLKLVTESADELTNVQRLLFEASQETRQSFEKTGELYSRISRSTKELNLSQEQLLGITDTINKSLVISGASAQAADAALIQLGQGFAAGALRGQELNSVLEQAPRLAEAIADSLGVPVGQLRKIAEQGGLTSKVLVDALSKGSNAARAISIEFSKMDTTVGQSTVRIKNSVMKMIGEFDTATGATAAIANSFSAIAENMDEIANVATIAAVGSIPVALSQIATAAPKAAAGIKVLTLAMAANPWILAATGLAAAGTALYQLRDSAREVVNDGTIAGVSAKIKQLETDLEELNKLGRNPLLGKPYRAEAKETEAAIASLSAELAGLKVAASVMNDVNKSAINALKSFEKAHNTDLFTGIEKQYQAIIDKALESRIKSAKILLEYYRDSENAKPEIVAAMESEIATLNKTVNDKKLQEAEKHYKAELKKLQEHNAKKYAEEIASAKKIGKDSWLIREQGMKDAAVRAADYQEQETQAFYDAEQERLEIAKKALEKYQEKVEDAQADMLDTTQEHTSAIIADWDNAGDMLIDIAKRTAADMAAAFLSQELIMPIATQVGSAMGMDWNGVGMGDIAKQSASSGVVDKAVSWVGSFFHTGGVPSVDSAPSMVMPASTFAGAPKFHNGLMPGEMAAIIKDDEGVFTPGQMKALGQKAQGHQVVNHYHITVNALDAPSVQALLLEHAETIGAAVVMDYKNDGVSRSGLNG